MADIMMNPGAGPVQTGTWEQAYENIKQYIKDCEIPLHIVRSEFISDEGRYLFVLGADDFPYSTEIEMPGLPLEKVRYMSEEGQNPFDFPRLYVDGSSWLWKFGIVTKEWVSEYMNDKIDELKEEIRKWENKIEEMGGENNKI